MCAMAPCSPPITGSVSLTPMTSRSSMSPSSGSAQEEAPAPVSSSFEGPGLGRSLDLPDGRADMVPPAPEYRLRDRTTQQSGEKTGDILDERERPVVFHAGRAEDADPSGPPLARLVGRRDQRQAAGRQLPRLRSDDDAGTIGVEVAVEQRHQPVLLLEGGEQPPHDLHVRQLRVV